MPCLLALLRSGVFAAGLQKQAPLTAFLKDALEAVQTAMEQFSADLGSLLVPQFAIHTGESAHS